MSFLRRARESIASARYDLRLDGGPLAEVDALLVSADALVAAHIEASPCRVFQHDGSAYCSVHGQHARAEAPDDFCATARAASRTTTEEHHG